MSTDGRKDMAGIQALLRTLIATAVKAVVAYRATGRIPQVNESLTEMEYHLSLAFLREVDEGIILLAGYQDDGIAKRAIEKVLASEEAVEIKEEQLTCV